MYYKKKKFLALAIGFYLAGFSHYTLADETAVADETAKSGDIIISATRTEQEVKETPAAVEIITKEEIEKLGAKNLGDALKLATNVDIGAPAMVGRGASLRGMPKRHVLILIDGKRLVSEGSFGSANNYELDRISMSNVERIEIVRGSVSALYGSEGMAGVINVITRKPAKKEATFSFSPWRFSNQWKAGTDDFFFRYDSGKKDKLSWIASYEHENISAHKNTDDTTRNQYGHRDTYDIQAVYNLPGNKYLDFAALYQRERFERISSTSAGGSKNLTLFHNERQHYSIGLRGSNAKSNYEVRTYYGIHDKYAPFYSLATGALNLDNSDLTQRKTWVLEGRVSTQWNDKHLVTAGGEYRTEDYWGTRVGAVDSPLTDIGGGNFKPAGDYKINTTAFYLQDEWVVNERLLIIPSLRYDSSNRFADNYSPKVGTTYKLNETFRLKANFGKGFKAPTIDDMFMHFKHDPTSNMHITVTGNPNLKPEKSTSYDLSIEGEKGRNFGKLTYFTNDINDMIYEKSDITTVAPPYPPQIYYDTTYVNLDKANIDGVEFEIGRHLNDKFALKLNYVYLDATGTIGGKTSQRLTGRARHRTALQLHYDDNKENGVSAVLWSEWNNNSLFERTADNFVKKNYNLWNVSFNKKWNNGLSGFIGIDNIFNKEDPELNLYGPMYKAGVTFKL